MTEEQLKALYSAEIDSSAPDKDALWAKIESRLTEKAPETAQTATDPTPKMNSPRKPLCLTVLKYAAACAVLLLAVPAALSMMQHSDSMSVTSPADEDISNADSAAENAADSDGGYVEAPDDAEDTDSPAAKPLSYSELEFSSYSETYYTCTGAPYGDSYFVEEDILAQTDVIVIGEVSRVYLTEDGSSIVYELINVQGADDASITVESRSPYTLRRGRQYLLPLARTEEGFRTVYDGVPQTELTSDGGMVYYNGWHSLDSAESESIIYPQQSEDAFFYDRMMFSRSSDISGLINRWNSARQA